MVDELSSGGRVRLTLPEDAHLEFLKKAAKDRLRAMRTDDPAAKLAAAQFALARSYGFPSWRALRAEVLARQEAAGPGLVRPDLDRFTGFYYREGGPLLTVTRDGERLFVQSADGRARPLVSSGESRFKDMSSPRQYAFSPDGGPAQEIVERDVLKRADGSEVTCDISAPRVTQAEAEAVTRVLRCSFCGKTSDEVDKLIAGPNIAICDECVGLCSEIIGETASPSRPIA